MYLLSKGLFWNLFTSSIVISVILDMEDLEYLFWNIDSSISDIFLVEIPFEYREMMSSSIPMDPA
jgi:hypothetical protein